MSCPDLPEASFASANFPVVALGASAGGLEALMQLLENLTPDTDMAYVVVQHLDPHHKSMLAEILSRRASIPVQEVRKRTKIAKNHVYVIPPNRNMYVEKGSLCLCSREALRAKEMPIDYLFRTLALDQPGNCIGIVLSGTGSDGSLGVEEIKATGGITFVQDLATAKFDSMPRSAISTNCVDYVMAPDAIALELRRIATHPFTSGKRIAELSQGNLLFKVFTILKNHSSIDFKHYKQNTVKRRIFRRMALAKVDSLAEYVKKLNEDPTEVDGLYQDLLIKVTNFFREPASFKLLQDVIFPGMIRDRKQKESIRIWVPACSTGEEVYSLAIALLESAGDRSGSLSIQFFGTDVSEEALKKARTGIYIENIALDVSPERLRRWFNRIDQGYQISKHIRDMCVFARHNVVIDPPFSKMDLISCRNLLIYFDSVFQDKVMPIFHYALQPGGHLMLGSSESVGNHVELFSPIDKKTKIYRTKQNSYNRNFSFQTSSTQEVFPPSIPPVVRNISNAQQEADRIVVSRFAPPGVIIDDDLKIVQFRGSTGDYLEPAPGHASFNLIKMARGNLGYELRTLFHRAKNSKTTSRNPKFNFHPKDGLAQEVALEITPLKTESGMPSNYLVLFERLETTHSSGTALPLPQAGVPSPEWDNLRRELEETRANLQSTIEDTEATSEELKSANEEIRSSNEELQSTNEELETAKEELQSANEELTTVNEEVQARNKELSQLNSDLTNFLVSVSIPIIMLGTDLRIRRFTPLTQRVFNLIPTDIGRPFGDIKPKIDVRDLEKNILRVIETMTMFEKEVQDEKGHYYRMSIRPYRTQENRIEGAVLVFQDVDVLRRNMFDLEAAKAFSEGIVEGVTDPLLVLDSDLKVRQANSAYYKLFQTRSSAVEGRSLFHLGEHQWEQKEVRQWLRQFRKEKGQPPFFVLEDNFSGIGRKVFQVQARQIEAKGSESKLILLSLHDVTEREKFESEKNRLHRELEKEKSLFEAVLQQVHIGVAIFEGHTGKLLLANDRLPSILGWKIPKTTTLSTLVQNGPKAYHADGTVLKAKEWPMYESLATKRRVNGKQLVLKKGRSGKSILEVSSSPVLDEKGEILAVVATFADVTDQIEVQTRVVEASNREQRRIAHELHDGLGQQLAAIGYRLKALRVKLSSSQNEESKDAAEIGKLVETSLAGSRDLASFLLPVDMDSTGLMHSLKELAATSSRLYQVDCTFLCLRPVLISNAEASLVAFRIAQESIRNAIKHGKPKKIIIRLVKQGSSLSLSIANNGTDFSSSSARRRKGMGIEIMRYRAGIIRGTLTVEKHRPKGTIVVFTFKA